MKSSMKRWRDGIIILLMAFSLLACQGDVAEARHYPDKIHLPVDYGDMVFTGFDETVLQDVLEEIQELYDSGALQKKDVQTRLRVEELYESMKAELNNLTTQVSLLGIQYDANGAEEELAETSAELASRGSALYDQCYQALALLVDTPYQNIIEADAGEINIERLRNYEALSDRMFELHDEEERLVQSYDRVMAQPQVTVDGEVWTEEKLSSADLSNSEYRNISEQLEQAQNQEAGEIYRELIRVRTEIAEEAGYDNYIDYAYEVVYNRDYSLEDIQQVWKSVKKTIVPMEDYLMEGISSRDLRGLHRDARSDGEEILDAIQPFMGRIDPELGETFDFMRNHHLYDIEYSDSKLYVGYTVGLPAYGTAFIFNQPYRNYQDYIDTIHEFGHFNETFHCVQHDLWADFNIDVGEIHSQGLTLLFTEYSDELFGEYGDAFSRIILWNMLDTIMDGCLYDEFQATVYQNPDMSLEEINRLYKELSEEYGYQYDEDEEEGYYWIQVSHNFQSPFYYISYATSALSSLDLWLISLEDREQAVDIYLELAALSLSLPYRETIEEVGLRDIFRQETIPEMAKELRDYLGISAGNRRSSNIWECFK
ncbi:MAG: M3 family oligoendopeptidase [Lachnospiraceae bacterium]|nr:M3 family oligoendopeptidase [Lachnospiraceae bacterium]